MIQLRTMDGLTLQDGCSSIMGAKITKQVSFLSWGPSSLPLEILYLAKHVHLPLMLERYSTHSSIPPLLRVAHSSPAFFHFHSSGIFSPINVTESLSLFKELRQLQDPGIKRSETPWIRNRDSHLAITGSAIN